MAHKKKSKKEKSKKHKREKSKKHKKEKYRSKKYSSGSSSGSSDSEEEWVEGVQQGDAVQSEWNFLETALNDSNVTVKEKKIKKTNQSIDRPGQSSRELNPYWKNGGTGLPGEVSAEKLESKHTSIRYKSDPGTVSHANSQYKNENEKFGSSENDKRKLGFLKPEEHTNFSISKSSSQRNWKKRDYNLEDVKLKEEKQSLKTKDKNENVGSSKILSNDDLNNLAAKLVKAEILGDKALIEKLKMQLEAAKKSKIESSVGMESQEKGKVKEVLIVGTEGKLPITGSHSHNPSKRQKIDTHVSNERVCYFPDDDKYSLKNLFEKEKTGSSGEILLPSKRKNPDELDDAYLEAAASQKSQEKLERKQNENLMKDAILRHKTLEKCRWCLDNRNETKHLIVSTGLKCYLCLPEEESLNKGHCIIVPVQHETSTRHLDEDVWDEMKTYKKALTEMFSEQGQDIVFFENARSFKYYPHCFVQCVPLDKEMGDSAPIYFQKALLESETEWSDNKKLIDFRRKDLRKSIPKGLPYFAIDFGNDGGFAHIIEDEHLFPRNFAEEIIGGMMDLESRKWRKPQKENFRAQRSKALDFLKMWKKFEFNERSKDVWSDSDSSTSE